MLKPECLLSRVCCVQLFFATAIPTVMASLPSLIKYFHQLYIAAEMLLKRHYFSRSFLLTLACHKGCASYQMYYSDHHSIKLAKTVSVWTQ